MMSEALKCETYQAKSREDCGVLGSEKHLHLSFSTHIHLDLQVINKKC